MAGVVCPFHEQPVIGFSNGHRCFYCAMCEDCTGDEGNITADKVPDEGMVMTHELGDKVLEVEKCVQSVINRIETALDQAENGMVSVRCIMNNPDSFFETVGEQIKGIVDMFNNISGLNESDVMLQVKKETLELVDVTDPMTEILQREIRGLEEWYTHIEGAKKELENRLEREMQISALLNEFRTYEMNEMVEDKMKLVLHVVTKTDWLERDVELPNVPERPRAPELPVFGRLKESAEKISALVEENAALREQLEKQQEETGQERKRLKEEIERLQSEIKMLKEGNGDFSDCLRTQGYQLSEYQEREKSFQRRLNERDAEIKRTNALMRKQEREFIRHIKTLESQLLSDSDNLSTLTRAIMTMKRDRRILELRGLLSRRTKLIPSVEMAKRVYDPKDFVSFPGVEELEWVRKVREMPMKSVLGFECSEAVRIDGLTDGNIDSVALSQFGVLMIYESWKGELHFHDLVDETHSKIGGFKNVTNVGWYKSDVVAVTLGESVVRRASYVSLLKKPEIGTFNTFIISRCSGWTDLQLSQYTGKIVYPSTNNSFVILNLESLGMMKRDFSMWRPVNAGCVIPEGIMGLVTTGRETFFVDESAIRTQDMGVVFWCREAILSLSEPNNLNKALMRGGDWHVPDTGELVNDDDFRRYTGWDGCCFVRLIENVFLIHRRRTESNRWIRDGWYVIRILVP